MMKKLIWKVRYAINIRKRAELPWVMAWEISDTAWDVKIDFPMSPEDAVTEELSCWGE